VIGKDLQNGSNFLRGSVAMALMYSQSLTGQWVEWGVHELLVGDWRRRCVCCCLPHRCMPCC
jgi:hypothetical protein